MSIESDLVDWVTLHGGYAKAVENDVYVEWYLSDLLEFCQNYRSEIEELG